MLCIEIEKNNDTIEVREFKMYVNARESDAFVWNLCTERGERIGAQPHVRNWKNLLSLFL